MRSRFLGIVVAASATVLASCASREFGYTTSAPMAPADGPMPASSNAPDAALPVQWSRGIPIVETWIDGHGPLRFVLDSGASFVGVDTRVAAALRLDVDEIPPDTPDAPIGDTGAGLIGFRRFANLKELRTGVFLMRDIDAVVFDLSMFEQAAGDRFDGVLPARAFGAGLLTVDPARDSVTYSAGVLPAADGRSVVALNSDGPANVSVDVAGVSCSIVIDTGSNGFLDLPAAREASLRFRSPPAVVGHRATAAGTTTRRAGRIDGTIRWGDCSVVDPVIGLSTSSFGWAGMKLLAEFETTFDFANERVRFERAEDGPIRSRSIRSPGAETNRQNGVWTVAFVDAGTPTERAGLRVGDRVEAVDGRPISSPGIDDYVADVVANKDGMKLRVVRDGAALDLDVAIVTLVE